LQADIAEPCCRRPLSRRWGRRQSYVSASAPAFFTTETINAQYKVTKCG
jgi:hypothetical protein